MRSRWLALQALATLAWSVRAVSFGLQDCEGADIQLLPRGSWVGETSFLLQGVRRHKMVAKGKRYWNLPAPPRSHVAHCHAQRAAYDNIPQTKKWRCNAHVCDTSF